jgi:hypothetical protein
MQNAQHTITAGTVLTHIKHGFTVVFKNMVNANEFRTMNDFQYYINEFTIVNP